MSICRAPGRWTPTSRQSLPAQPGRRQFPGEDHFINFRKGDPYVKVDEGYARLPGAGYEALHPELEGVDHGLVDELLEQASSSPLRGWRDRQRLEPRVNRHGTYVSDPHRSPLGLDVHLQHGAIRVLVLLARVGRYSLRYRAITFPSWRRRELVFGSFVQQADCRLQVLRNNAFSVG